MGLPSCTQTLPLLGLLAPKRLILQMRRARLCRLGLQLPSAPQHEFQTPLPGVLGSSGLVSTCLPCLTIYWDSVLWSLHCLLHVLCWPSPPSHLFSSCSVQTLPPSQASLESQFPGSPPCLRQPSMVSLPRCPQNTAAHIVRVL